MATAQEKDRAVRSLNRLLSAEQESLIPHLSESFPFVSWAGADEALVLEDVVREQLEHIEWMIETILAAGGAPAPRRPAMALASVHYCDVESLVPRIVEDKRKLIGLYESTIPQLAAVQDATAVAGRCLERHRKHLKAIEDTFSTASA